ncbi:MAG TPA: aminotransferase class III-fold pyridoxal phosphate-dependent enzyme [Edaphobacter sp.]|nr:aminotransferase class III-fold pyridoxal phosphate-dependent enzyme [Edaphobacter sp.]
MADLSLRELEQNHVIYGWQNQSVLSPSIFERAEHIYLWDSDGKRYADFASGQINVNVGYGHSKVLNAMRQQMERMTYIAPMFATEARIRLASMVAECAPGNLQYVFFTNSGAEAVENALKIARAVTGRHKIYSAWQSYHGATAAASAISGDARRLYVEPALPGLGKFHYPNCYRCPLGLESPSVCGIACLESLRNQILMDGPETISAIVVEPIVGTSGLYIPPGEFILGLREICNQHGILLIFDETMSGWGRTGRWFACEHFDVVPDILTTAKGITSAYVPLGAVVVNESIRNHFKTKNFVGGLTTEGHALACSAGIANIDVYREEKLIDNSALLGEYLLLRLNKMKQLHPSVGDVRGKGLFACIEFSLDRKQKTPLAGYRNSRTNIASEVTRRLWDLGVVVIAKRDFLFIAPPLVITKEELDHGMDAIDAVLQHTDQMLFDGCV